MGQWVLNLAGLLLLDTVERHQTLVFSPRNLVQKWPLWPTLVVIKLKLIPMEESKSMEMESASQKERNMFIVNLVLKSSKFSNGELASMSTLSCVFGYVQILPAPSTRGDQCGLCGNFNRNQFDEYMGKDGVTMAPSSGDQVAQWKWKC